MLRRRHYRRTSPGSMFSFVILVLILLLLVEGLLVVERKIRPSILAAAVMECDAAATRAINNAILDKVVGNTVYKDLITVEQDEKGKIVMAQINTGGMNRIMAETTNATGDALAALSEQPLEIPLGEIFDSYILAAYGPKIPVRLMPMGRVNTALIDSFEDAGINQTRHKIYLQVITEVQVVVPLITDSIEVITVMPLADTIYIGEVPDTLINLSYPRRAAGDSGE